MAPRSRFAAALVLASWTGCRIVLRGCGSAHSFLFTHSRRHQSPKSATLRRPTSRFGLVECAQSFNKVQLTSRSHQTSRGASKDSKLGQREGEAKEAKPVAPWVLQTRQIWSDWAARNGLQGFSGLLSMDYFLQWRVQRLELEFPLREKFVDPFLPGGPREGDLTGKFLAWGNAGILQGVLEDVEASEDADLQENDDYDLLMGNWAMQGLGELLESDEQLESPLILAMAIYLTVLRDPTCLEDLMQVVPFDASITQEAELVRQSLPSTLAVNEARFNVEYIKSFDSLFIGHSNFHTKNIIRPWEDECRAILRQYSEMARRPLYNDMFPYHQDDLTRDLLTMDQASLATLMPLGHFNIIAAIGLVLDPDDMRNIRSLLKPGGIFIDSVFWRSGHAEEGALLTKAELEGFGFSSIQEEILPLDFAQFPFSSLEFRMRTARLAPEA